MRGAGRAVFAATLFLIVGTLMLVFFVLFELTAGWF